MRAVQVVDLTGPEALTIADVPEPAGDDLVVVDVAAAGVAYPDLLASQGRYQMKRPLPFVPGMEAAGVVRSAPAGAHVAAGDRVIVLALGGAWQEVLAVPPDAVFPIPPEVSYEAGAGILLNYLTCWFALQRRGRAEPGETLLVHGAAGGVGVAAVQLGKALGLRTIAVVSDERKRAYAVAAGADETVAVDGFLPAVKELTGGRGVDLVIDPVGGDRFTDSLRSLAPEGRLLVLGFVGGDIPTVKVNRLLLNNTQVVGVGWGEFVRSHPGYVQEQWNEMLPLLAKGELRPVEGEPYPFDRAADALNALADRSAIGKLVLTPR